MVGKMDERSGYMPVSPRACFYFFLIVKDSKLGLIDLKMRRPVGLFGAKLLFSPQVILMECREDSEVQAILTLYYTNAQGSLLCSIMY